MNKHYMIRSTLIGPTETVHPDLACIVGLLWMVGRSIQTWHLLSHMDGLRQLLIHMIQRTGYNLCSKWCFQDLVAPMISEVVGTPGTHCIPIACHSSMLHQPVIHRVLGFPSKSLLTRE